MGKRELLIVVAFVAVGAVAYQFSAPPAKTNQGFSFARLFQRARDKVQSDRAQASVTATGTVAAHPGLSEIRLARFNRGITVIGEPRTDIAYELKVDSTGPDEDTARAYAKRTTLSTDDLGSALAVAAEYPSEGSQVAELTLHVPARLSVRLDSSPSGHIRIAGVAGVRFENTTGESVLERISGAVTGQYRAGSVSVSGSASVDLTLQATTVTLDHVTQKVMLSSRAGRAQLTDIGGAIDIDSTNTELTITDPLGPVHVGNSSGRIKVLRPRASVDIEGRRCMVDVTLATAVPMTILTSEEPLHLWFAAAPPAIQLDATASDGGFIRADDPRLGLEVTKDDKTSKLTHAFAAGATTRVVLRNQRGEIVIGPAK